MSVSEVFAATRRAVTCHLLIEDTARPVGTLQYQVATSNLREFLRGGVRYVFPGEYGPIVRGFRAAQSAEPLAKQIAASEGEPLVVWPHRDGNARSVSLKPIYRTAVDAALSDQRLYRWLALTDALRLENPRIRSLAMSEISCLIDEIEHEQH